MSIPREDDMVRFYVPLGGSAPPVEGSQRHAYIISAAKRILHPYTLTYRSCYWSSFYQVGQKLANKFSVGGRVFLVGDALHTHSPKAGQGLNVSIQDAYNLGWKLAMVLKRRAKPCLLETYEKERRPVAQFLLRFDSDFQRFFHQPMTEKNFSMLEYRSALSEAVTIEHAELSGISACYADQHLMNDPVLSQQALASGIEMGKRIPDTVVVNHADGRGRHMHELLPSDGKWRIIVFAGDLTIPPIMERFIQLGRGLLAPECPLRAFTPHSEPLSDFFEVITVHRAPRHTIELLDLPSIFHPWNDRRGWDYGKVFVDDKTYHEDAGHAYATYGVDERQPCILVLRPDQHVCIITQPESLRSITTYLSQWLYVQTPKEQITEVNGTNGHAEDFQATYGHWKTPRVALEEFSDRDLLLDSHALKGDSAIKCET